MNSLEKNIKEYSTAVVKLLKSTVERDSVHWDTIINYQYEIQEYISLMGLELIVKKDEGFAYLKQFEKSDGTTLGLISRRQLGFEVSLLLIVLRHSLEEFDNNPTQYLVTEKMITGTEIKDELELFLPKKFDRVKLMKEFESYIKKVVDLGYLKEIKRKDNEITYQIHRIIKEKITLDALQEFKTKLDGDTESV
jgi:hypothetical protein